MAPNGFFVPDPPLGGTLAPHGASMFLLNAKELYHASQVSDLRKVFQPRDVFPSYFLRINFSVILTLISKTVFASMTRDLKGQGISCHVTLKTGEERPDALRKEPVARVRKGIAPIPTPNAIQQAPAFPRLARARSCGESSARPRRMRQTSWGILRRWPMRRWSPIW